MDSCAGLQGACSRGTTTCRKRDSQPNEGSKVARGKRTARTGSCADPRRCCSPFRARAQWSQPGPLPKRLLDVSTLDFIAARPFADRQTGVMRSTETLQHTAHRTAHWRATRHQMETGKTVFGPEDEAYMLRSSSSILSASDRPPIPRGVPCPELPKVRCTECHRCKSSARCVSIIPSPLSTRL